MWLVLILVLGVAAVVLSLDVGSGTTTSSVSPSSPPSTSEHSVTVPTTATGGATWTDPQVTITARSLGAVQVGMTLGQAQTAAGLTFDGAGDGMYYPTSLADHLYVGLLSGPTVSCVGASQSQSAESQQTVATPEGFRLGGSVASLLTIYGSHAVYVPAHAGIQPVAGYIVAENGGNLFFYVYPNSATVIQIAGGPNVSDGNSCSG